MSRRVTRWADSVPVRVGGQREGDGFAGGARKAKDMLVEERRRLVIA